ncbi:PREDICTED: probable disease resistance protein At5g45510 [Camelina sativa]|uniref:Probable disease resistance protein At5g45510 n=1 Tax=Camelina sativa TaxID=90675 RepID=A0ABM0V1G5_CAMSA|nr:PREDICTED: probable disease resistance protein At5g45510 [Camelina sativa]
MQQLRDMASAQLRQAAKDEKLCKMIVETMGGDDPQRVVLAGKSGIGKTRLARNVGKYATEEGMCYLTLWLNLNEKFEDEMSLYENIAFQLDVYVTDDNREKDKKDFLKDLKHKIILELKDKKKKHTSSYEMVPYLLLILDDEGNKTSEDTVMNDLGLESFLEDYKPLKILLTRRVGVENTTKHSMEIEAGNMEEPHDTRECKFHTTDLSQTLLCTLTESNMHDLFASLTIHEGNLLESLEKAWKSDEPLIHSVVRKSSNLPAAIVVLAKSLSCIAHQNSFKSLSPKQEKVLKKILSPCEPANSVSRCNPILQLAYQLLETDDTLKNAIVDCFWHSFDCFKHCGCIHYNELITHWILEGYFDPVQSVKKAFKDGHDILLELINRGLLKIQEDDMVVPEMAMSDLIDLRHHGFLGRSRLQLARTYGGDKKKGLGEITQIDDMIKTAQANKQEYIYTILVGGNRLRRATPKEFFEQPQMKNLEVLGLFYPTLEHFIQSLGELKQLRALVIRDYDLLPSIEELKGLRRLEVLEVSGASSVETIFDDFFEALPELQSLNLSGLRIISSPSSISQLKNLHTLILRDCLVLEDLPDIQHLDRLEVVDIRGARKLRTCFEKNTSKNQTFSRLQRLVLLDLSESKLKRLPIFHDTAVAANLSSLTRLSLYNCSNLVELPNLRTLSGLQILDLSSMTSLVEIAAVCFEQKEELKILNMSGTSFTKLPSTISGLSNLRQLLLRNCSNLETLPNISGLKSLEVFDVSGCTKLHTIEGSFKYMSYLQEVNLSGTRIETLIELPEKSSISCSKLVVLADSRRLIHETWRQVKEAVTNEIYESLRSHDVVDRIHEISRKEEGTVGELRAFGCPEKKGRHKELFYQGHTFMNVYRNIIPFVDANSCQEVLEIQGSNCVDQDKETLAKVEFVAIVDNTAASLSSVFNDLKSVKGCWLEMCADIEILFTGVDEERLGNLETLSITNFRLLESICCSSFNNLKNLSLDCCPHIKTIFPASALPTSLEVLKLKFCEKLEKVFEQEVEVPNLHTLCLYDLPVLSAINAMLPNLKTYNKEKCPKLETSKWSGLGSGLVQGGYEKPQGSRSSI